MINCIAIEFAVTRIAIAIAIYCLVLTTSIDRIAMKLAGNRIAIAIQSTAWRRRLQ